LEDFLSAGKINAKPEENPEIHSKIKTLFEELGGMWEAGEAKYENTSCTARAPF
jgi:hypothetical protein